MAFYNGGVLSLNYYIYYINNMGDERIQVDRKGALIETLLYVTETAVGAALGIPAVALAVIPLTALVAYSSKDRGPLEMYKSTTFKNHIRWVLPYPVKFLPSILGHASVQNKLSATGGPTGPLQKKYNWSDQEIDALLTMLKSNNILGTLYAHLMDPGLNDPCCTALKGKSGSDFEADFAGLQGEKTDEENRKKLIYTNICLRLHKDLYDVFMNLEPKENDSNRTKKAFDIMEAVRRPSDWTEKVDSATGKTYYFKGNHTQWERPGESEIYEYWKAAEFLVSDRQIYSLYILYLDLTNKLKNVEEKGNLGQEVLDDEMEKLKSKVSNLQIAVDGGRGLFGGGQINKKRRTKRRMPKKRRTKRRMPKKRRTKKYRTKKRMPKKRRTKKRVRTKKL